MEPDRVFGDVADEYDRRRPTDPQAMVDAALDAAPEPWRILESGAGAGKATELFAARGVPVTAVEPDARMASRLAGRCAGADVTVVVARFEDFEPEPDPFTIGLAAQSWHTADHRWLPDDLRAALLADVGAAIDEHGGAFDYRYETELVLLRRR